MKKLQNTLYVTDPDARLVKADDALSVLIDERQVLHVPFHLLDGIVLFGYRGLSAPLLGACAERGISVSLLDANGRFLARLEGPVSGNVLLRRGQHRMSAAEESALEVAKRFVEAKIVNERRVLERYRRDYPDEVDQVFVDAIEALRHQAAAVSLASTADQLRGVEGDAAHRYFSVFDQMIRVDDPSLHFGGRSRRPPLDAINALLSFSTRCSVEILRPHARRLGLIRRSGSFIVIVRGGRVWRLI